MKNFEKPDNCPICLDTLLEEDFPLENCGHWFHKNCIINAKCIKCPICRCDIDEDELSTKDIEDFSSESSGDSSPEDDFSSDYEDLDDAYKNEAYYAYFNIRGINYEYRHEFYGEDLEFLKQLAHKRKLTRSDKEACIEAIRRARC